LASLALARSGWQLYLLFALLGLLTPGNIPYARILGGWFERRRGAAYGILGLGFGVGGPLALYHGRRLEVLELGDASAAQLG
ncbi:hypothetical protein QM304_33560, partial [Pseudomonas aeruginosa]|nr:hypothetical protein [Pseudomonas aeruginosa]